MTGIPRRSYHRWLAKARAGMSAKGPWPAPVVDPAEALVARYAADWPAWGHRKIFGLMRADGHTLYIGLPQNHPLVNQPLVRLADLADAQWIQGVRQGTTLEVLPRACRLAGFEPNILLRTDDRMAVEALVVAGVGVALVPKLTVPTVRPDMVVRPLDSEALVRRVRVALPRSAYRSPAAAAMVAVLQTVCAELVVETSQRMDHPGTSRSAAGRRGGVSSSRASGRSRRERT